MCVSVSFGKETRHFDYSPYSVLLEGEEQHFETHFEGVNVDSRQSIAMGMEKKKNRRKSMNDLYYFAFNIRKDANYHLDINCDACTAKKKGKRGK